MIFTFCDTYFNIIWAFAVNKYMRTSLVVRRLRLSTPSAGGPGLIPGQGTQSCMPQLRVRMLQLKPGTAK